MLSAIMEDYLKAIYHLQQGSDGRVKTSVIAEYMDVEPPTVTSMMNKLADRDFVLYEPYRGVELTDTGTSIALEVIRYHRLLERYLTEYLEYDWSEVHDEADQLEHHVSEQFAERVAEVLGDPEIDPHGDPIPTAELELTPSQSRETLDDHQEGERVEIVRVRDREPEVLEYLSDYGIQPGTTAEITEVAPFGMITLRPDDEEDSVGLPEEVAQSIYAHSLEEDSDRS